MAQRYLTAEGRFTEREILFFAAIREGLPPAAACARAGYAQPAQSARSLLARPAVQDNLARIQAEIAEVMNVSRLQVFAMLKEAYEMATLKEEANNMIGVAKEISKLCGYYSDAGDKAAKVAGHLIDATSEDPFRDATIEQLENLSQYGDLDD